MSKNIWIDTECSGGEPSGLKQVSITGRTPTTPPMQFFTPPKGTMPKIKILGGEPAEN